MFQVRFRPDQIHPSVFIAQGAVIVGDVTLAEDVSIWFNAVLRGDTEALTIGARTNIQDGCIFHADPGYPTIVGVGCTIGHRAIVHGARVGDNTIIGMGAILLNGVVVGENCIVGAGALVTQGKVFPAGSLILGSPAKTQRELTPDEIMTNRLSGESYVEKARTFKNAG
jgi:carbonic anhydrase/acetyltransferase-like protein (isoleucine patch superfamily)